MFKYINEFRKSLTNERLPIFYEAIADFGDRIAVDFPIEFPDLPPDEYQRVESWHVLVGSTLPKDYSLTESSEVREWMEQKITELIDSLRVG